MTKDPIIKLKTRRHETVEPGNWKEYLTGFILLISGVVLIWIFIIIAAIYWIPPPINGYVVMIVLFVTGGALPALIVNIKIPTKPILVVDLNPENETDDIFLIHMPLHIYEDEWERQGFSPPIRINGQDGIIADGISYEKKILKLPWSKQYHNLHYLAQKQDYLLIKDEYKTLILREFRRIYMTDVTSLAMAMELFKEANEKIFNKPVDGYRAGSWPKGSLTQGGKVGDPPQDPDKLQDEKERDIKKGLAGKDKNLNNADPNTLKEANK